MPAILERPNICSSSNKSRAAGIVTCSPSSLHDGTLTGLLHQWPTHAGHSRAAHQQQQQQHPEQQESLLALHPHCMMAHSQAYFIGGLRMPAIPELPTSSSNNNIQSSRNRYLLSILTA